MNKHKTSTTNFIPAFLLAASIVALLGYSFVNAQPQGTPPGGNVEANFDSVKLPNGPKMTGSQGHFVGLSLGTYDGNDFGGYEGAISVCNQLPKCNSADPNDGCHICTAQEIVYSYENNLPDMPGSGWGWINSGPPGYFSSLSNDCNGWTSGNTESPYFSIYGAKWGFAEKYAKITSCDQELQIACCKY